MTEHELEPPRLPLAETAARLGKSVDAVRAMIRRGKLATQRGNDGRLLVSVPPKLAQAAGEARPGDGEAGDQSGLGARLGEDGAATRLLVERDEALAEADHWREKAHLAELAQARAEAAAEAKDALIEELRAMLAEARRPWWRRLLGAIAVSTLFALSPPTSASDGNDLKAFCESRNPIELGVCHGYIQAVAEVMSENTINGFRACLPDNPTRGQLNDVVLRHLSDFPQQRHLLSDGLVAMIFSKNFPCP
jgi:hypothetical protein